MLLTTTRGRILNACDSKQWIRAGELFELISEASRLHIYNQIGHLKFSGMIYIRDVGSEGVEIKLTKLGVEGKRRRFENL